jgi:hypothetical protein
VPFRRDPVGPSRCGRSRSAPLRLEPQGAWDPKEEYWGEEGEPLDDWTRRIIAWGPRMAFEMEQVLPMDDPDDPDGDPIVRSNERRILRRS